jgi:hypothetical protein
MKLLDSIYEEFVAVSWFAKCGLPDGLPSDVMREESRDNARARLLSSLWEDVRTEAQGDLTGFLAKHHYDSYGGHWNRLARESRTRLDKSVKHLLQSRLSAVGLAEFESEVLLDLNRAAMEASYRICFPKAPSFFSRLLDVYRSGHLPCGWTDTLDRWPVGRLLAY